MPGILLQWFPGLKIETWGTHFGSKLAKSNRWSFGCAMTDLFSADSL